MKSFSKHDTLIISQEKHFHTKSKYFCGIQTVDCLRIIRREKFGGESGKQMN